MIGLAEHRETLWEALKILIPLVGVVGILYIIWAYFVGPAHALYDQWRKQYEDYTGEFKEYSKQTNGALTEDQWRILEAKKDMLEKTQEKIFLLGQGMEQVILGLIATAGVVAGVYLVSKVAKDYFVERLKTKQAQERYALTNLMEDAVAVDYAHIGQAALAYNTMVSVDTHFNMVTQGLMTSEIAMWNAQLPYLTGLHLLYAQFMISALTIQMAYIPMMISAAWLLIPIP